MSVYLLKYGGQNWLAASDVSCPLLNTMKLLSGYSPSINAAWNLHYIFWQQHYPLIIFSLWSTKTLSLFHVNCFKPNLSHSLLASWCFENKCRILCSALLYYRSLNEFIFYQISSHLTIWRSNICVKEHSFRGAFSHVFLFNLYNNHPRIRREKWLSAKSGIGRHSTWSQVFLIPDPMLILSLFT